QKVPEVQWHEVITEFCGVTSRWQKVQKRTKNGQKTGLDRIGSFHRKTKRRKRRDRDSAFCQA
ncbi:MAG TPA: hypothetical protein V6C81_12545, partial [Planktothrix sp.]